MGIPSSDYFRTAEKVMESSRKNSVGFVLGSIHGFHQIRNQLFTTSIPVRKPWTRKASRSCNLSRALRAVNVNGPEPNSFWYDAGGAENLEELPQTMEYALEQCRIAVKNALINECERLIIELPMGRTKNSFGLAPLSEWLGESGIYALHLAELFKGSRIRMVYCHPPALEQKVTWLTAKQSLNQAVKESIECDILIIASATKDQLDLVHRLIENVPRSTAIVIFNGFMDMECSEIFPAFHGYEYAYFCRAYPRTGAVLKLAHDKGWNTFVEIGPFEYEWVSCLDTMQLRGDDNQLKPWIPSRTALEIEFQKYRLVRRESMGFFKESKEWRSAGFWPFMGLAMPWTKPLSDDDLDQLRKYRAETFVSKSFFGFTI